MLCFSALPSTGKGKRGAKDTKKSDPKQKVVAASKDKERVGDVSCGILCHSCINMSSILRLHGDVLVLL